MMWFETTKGPFEYNLLLLKLKVVEIENWKHCSKIIFKCVNSVVGLIFNKKVVEKWCLWGSWTVNRTHWCTLHRLFCCEQYTSWWKVYSEQVEKSKTTAGKKKKKKKRKEKKHKNANAGISWIQTLTKWLLLTIYHMEDYFTKIKVSSHM